MTQGGVFSIILAVAFFACNLAVARVTYDPEDLCPDPGTIVLDGDTYNVEPIGCDNFEYNTWEDTWYLETIDGTVSVVDGKLQTNVPKGGIGVNMWFTGYNNGELPKDILVKYKAKNHQSGPGWLQIIMLNTHVRNTDGSEYLLGTFSGKDGDYHQNLKIYRFSFTHKHLSLRVNPLYNNLLYQDTSTKVEVDREYEFAVVVKDGRMKMYIDDVLQFDVAHFHSDYPDPYDGGKVGLRTNKSEILWDDFEFYAFDDDDDDDDDDDW